MAERGTGSPKPDSPAMAEAAAGAVPGAVPGAAPVKESGTSGNTRKPQAKKHGTGWEIARGIAFVVILGFSAWTVCFFAVGALLDYSGFRGPSYVRQLIIWIASFLLLGAAASVAGRIFAPKRQDFFLVLSEAMKKIASGDFSVSVPVGQPGALDSVASSLNQMAESLKKIETMRQDFVSDVSHEIQSPLTSIAGFARVLHDENLGSAQRGHYLRIIESEAQRLSKLSDSLLKLNSVESQAQNLRLATYRLDSQIRSVVLSCEPQWTAKKITLDLDLDSVQICADEDMLNQVLANLIHNAVKFTPEGGAIRVESHRSGEWTTVSVRDSGIGISPENLPRVFDRFFKADPSRGNGGSGLGLAIAKGIVKLHRGEITVESDGEGRGSAFTVKIPISY